MGYDAFISYSHSAGSELAPAIERGLKRFARRKRQIRALEVFRDQSSLHVTPGLWPQIEEALNSSTYFILLASPESACSEWVKQELSAWLEKDPEASRLLIVLTKGVIEWDSGINDFDWGKTSALPDVLVGKFASEPLYENLCWVNEGDSLSLSNAKFTDSIASLSSTITGIRKEDLFGIEIREQRRRKRIQQVVTVVISVITMGLIALFVQSNYLKKKSKASQLLSFARSEQSLDIERATLLAAEVEKFESSPQGYEVLKESYDLLPEHVKDLPESEGPVSGMFSPHGGLFAAGFADGSVRIWETGRWTKVSDFRLIKSVRVLAFSRDGSKLAAADDDGNLSVYDVEKESVLWSRKASLRAVAIDFNHDGSCLLTIYGGIDTTKTMLDYGQVRDSKDGSFKLKILYHSPLTSGFFINEGKQIVTGSNDGSVRVWDAFTGKQADLLLEPGRKSTDSIEAMAKGQDENAFAAITFSSIYLWNSQDLTEEFHAFSGGINLSLTLCERKKDLVLAVGNAEGSVRLFRKMHDFPDQPVGETFVKLPFNTVNVAINPRQDFFSAGTGHGVSCMWKHVSLPDMIARISTNDETDVTVLEYDPEGRYLVVGTEYGKKLRVWKGWKANKYVAISHKGSRKIRTFDFHPTKPQVITVADTSDFEGRTLSDAEVALWDYSADLEKPLYIMPFREIVRDVAVSNDGLLAVAASGRSVTLWNLDSSDVYREIVLPGEAQYVAFGKSSNLLAVACADSVLVFDSDREGTIARLGLPERVTEIEFSAKDRYLGVLCSEGPVYLYSGARWDRKPVIIREEEGQKKIFKMSFHPEKDLLFLGTEKDIALYNSKGKKNGELLVGDFIFTISLSKDGQFLVAENSDERGGVPVSVPVLFKTSSGDMLHQIPGVPLHRSPEFSFDGALIGALDYTNLILFPWSSRELVESAEASITRTLKHDERKRYLKGFLYFEKYHFFSFIRPEQRSTVLWFLILYMLYFLWLVSSCGKPLKLRETLSIEMPFTASRAQIIVEEWNRDDRAAAAVKQTRMDFFFLLFYPLVLSLGCAMAADSGNGDFYTGILLSWAVLACIPLDALENVLILKMLSGSFKKPIPQITTFSAVVKFMLLIASFAYLLYGFFLCC